MKPSVKGLLPLEIEIFLFVCLWGFKWFQFLHLANVLVSGFCLSFFFFDPFSLKELFAFSLWQNLSTCHIGCVDKLFTHIENAAWKLTLCICSHALAEDAVFGTHLWFLNNVSVNCHACACRQHLWKKMENFWKVKVDQVQQWSGLCLCVCLGVCTCNYYNARLQLVNKNHNNKSDIQ